MIFRNLFCILEAEYVLHIHARSMLSRPPGNSKPHIFLVMSNKEEKKTLMGGIKKKKKSSQDAERAEMHSTQEFLSPGTQSHVCIHLDMEAHQMGIKHICESRPEPHK